VPAGETRKIISGHIERVQIRLTFDRAKCEITNYRLWLERWRELFTATATFWPAPCAHLQH
jgi:hypothetical protein